MILMKTEASASTPELTRKIALMTYSVAGHIFLPFA